MTTDYKLTGLKNKLFHNFGGQKFKISLSGPKSSCGQNCAPFSGSGENLFYCLFRLLEAACIS